MFAMSPRRQPYSLYQRCVDHFAQSLSTLCDGHETELNNPQVISAAEYITKYLPLPIQADIGEEITSDVDRLQNILLPSKIQVLLRLRVRSLSLSGSVIQSGVLEHSDGPHIQNLSLLYRGCRDTATKMYGFLRTSIYLTHFTCTDFCSDEMLEIIADTCKNLVYLNLHACNDVSNEGILKLCGHRETTKEWIDLLYIGVIFTPISRTALTLREVKLKMTQVTEVGVAVLLLLVKNICLLRVPDIPMKQVFDFLGKISKRNSQSNLKEFRSRETLDENQLLVLTTLCPNLNYIQMTFTGNFDMDLLRLQILASLKHLTAVKFADVDTDALMIFLNAVGSHITYIQLYTYNTRFIQDLKLRITPDHIWHIGKCCLNLENLQLKGYNIEENISNIGNSVLCKESTYFQNTHTLKLEAMKMLEGDLKSLLYYCKNIKSLDLVLKDPHVLHDRLVSELLDNDMWRNLRKVRILNSPITSKIMKRLVRECPHLQELGCLTTWLIAKQQVTEFKEKVKSENLDIVINS